MDGKEDLLNPSEAEQTVQVECSPYKLRGLGQSVMSVPCLVSSEQ